MGTARQIFRKVVAEPPAWWVVVRCLAPRAGHCGQSHKTGEGCRQRQGAQKGDRSEPRWVF